MLLNSFLFILLFYTSLIHSNNYKEYQELVVSENSKDHAEEYKFLYFKGRVEKIPIYNNNEEEKEDSNSFEDDCLSDLTCIEYYCNHNEQNLPLHCNEHCLDYSWDCIEIDRNIVDDSIHEKRYFQKSSEEDNDQNCHQKVNIHLKSTNIECKCGDQFQNHTHTTISTVSTSPPSLGSALPCPIDCPMSNTLFCPNPFSPADSSCCGGGSSCCLGLCCPTSGVCCMNDPPNCCPLSTTCCFVTRISNLNCCSSNTTCCISADGLFTSCCPSNTTCQSDGSCSCP